VTLAVNPEGIAVAEDVQDMTDPIFPQTIGLVAVYMDIEENCFDYCYE